MTLKVDNIQNESSSEANVVLNTDGSISIPSQIKHVGDDNTLIEFETDTIKLQTAGSPRVVAKSDGKVGIGHDSPLVSLHVLGPAAGASTDTLRLSTESGSGTQEHISIGLDKNVADTHPMARIGVEEIDTGDRRGHLYFETRDANSDTAPTERMRIDSDGRALIGLTSTMTAGSQAQFSKFQIVGSTASTTGQGNITLGRGQPASGTISANNDLAYISFTDSVGSEFGQIGCLTDAATSSTSFPGRLVFKTTADGANTLSDRMVIDNAGNVGIGGNTGGLIDPDTLLHIRKDTNTQNQAFIKLENRVSGGSIANCHIEFQLENSLANDPRATIGVVENGADSFADIVFQSSPQSNSSTLVERMRIAANGRVGINTANATGHLEVAHDSSQEVGFVITNSNNGTMARFRKNSSIVGSITNTSSSTAYNTSSDYRLKENVVTLDGAITRVKQLAPKRFNFKADADTTVDGFLAHEAQTVVPEAVTGTKDAVEVWKEGETLPDGVSVGDNKLDEDGNTIPEMQGIDQAKLVPLLTAALQEAIAKIETLETKVAALEAG